MQVTALSRSKGHFNKGKQTTAKEKTGHYNSEHCMTMQLPVLTILGHWFTSVQRTERKYSSVDERTANNIAVQNSALHRNEPMTQKHHTKDQYRKGQDRISQIKSLVHST